MNWIGFFCRRNEIMKANRIRMDSNVHQQRIHFFSSSSSSLPILKKEWKQWNSQSNRFFHSSILPRIEERKGNKETNQNEKKERKMKEEGEENELQTKREEEEEEERGGRRRGRRERMERNGKGKEKEESMRDKNTSIALLVLTTIIGLIGLSYASVPLYRMFCEATGYGGAVKETKRGVATLQERRKETNINPEDRPITIYFNADSNSSVQWKFIPQQRQVTIIPGESALAFYKAKNPTNEPIIGVATYNIAPPKAASYFNKIQCFCFEEQRLEPGEEIDLPVFFYLDPTFLDDPSCKNVTEMTLSYTFFKSKSN